MKLGYIYKIVSPTGRIYIGQTTNLYERKRVYKEEKCHRQSLIYKSLKKYGWKAHKWDIVYKFDSHASDIDKLEELFIEFFKSYNADYPDRGLNLVPGGNSRRGYKRPTDAVEKSAASHRGRKKAPMTTEQKLKISKVLKERYRKGEIVPSMLGKKHSEETLRKQSECKKGIKHSEETKQKLSIALKGRPNTNKGKTWSEEIRDKMRMAQTGRKHPEEVKQKIGKSRMIAIVQLSLEGEFIKEWDSADTAVKSVDISVAYISMCCKGHQKQGKGFKWMYASEYYKQKELI